MATTISNLVTNPLGQAIMGRISPNPISLNPLLYAKAPAPTPVPAQQLSMPNYSGATSNLAPSLANQITSGSTSPTVGLAKPVASAPQPSAVGAIKSYTSGADGTQTTTYHPPEAPSDVNPNAQQGVLGSGAGQTVTPSTPQPPFNQAVTGLLGAPGQNAAVGQSAKDITDYYRGLINPITRGMVGQEIGDRTTGTQQVGEGNAQAAAQAGGELIKGLTNQEQNELTGTGQQLTAQSQAQSGLNNAGQLAQPRQQGYVNLNPLNPDTSGGGTAAGAAATGGATESAYQNALTKGTVQTNIGASGLGDATKQYTEANTYNTTASGQATVLQNILDTTGINASNFQDWNKAINNLQGRMGSTNYSQFVTGLSELQNAYSQLLSTGGNTPSANDATALAVLNPNSSASQIHASIQTLQKDAYAKLSALYGTAQTYQNITSNTGTSGASGSGGWGSLGD